MEQQERKPGLIRDRLDAAQQPVENVPHLSGKFPAGGLE
jgi:hypothetical protein